MTAVEPTTPTNTPTTGTRSRRDVLCGLMVALVAPGALVAACSDGGSSSGGATTGGGSTPAGGGSGSAQGLAALADVPDGGGLIVDNPAGGKILLARTGDEVKAYNAACTHMGTIVNAPSDGVAVCSNHGSEFSTEDGSATKGPATQPLPTIGVKVEGDQVVLA
ncbi:Rieske (2Fe-2S) protein [Actinophytocola sp. NPDC049390]|uniref:Rieske (2Fe-2S) protein n=1 Tax=Actinophytocola sp. NPDC049390 TaxID=3363894 RepID=UPI0037AE3C5A